MKITCDRERLLAAFQMAAVVAPRSNNKPILRNVKLEASGDSVVFTATDLEIGIRATASEVEVRSPGEALLPVDRFGSILKTSTDDQLEIEADESGAVIYCGRSKFNLPTENPDEFPSVAEFKEAKYHDVSARLLKWLIKRTRFAACLESSRYMLNGVLLEFTDEKIFGIGTDGSRLAKMEIPAVGVGGHSSEGASTIVPVKAMQLIEQSLTDPAVDVQVSARANQLMVKTPTATICARLVEGRFPKWRDVFPKRNGTQSIEFTAGPLNAAIQQAAIVTSEIVDANGKAVACGVDFNFSKGLLVLASEESNRGKSHVELPIGYDGPPVSIRLRPVLMLEFLRVLDAEKTFTFDLKDGNGAAVCTTDDGYGYVVMPLCVD